MLLYLGMLRTCRLWTYGNLLGHSSEANTLGSVSVVRVHNATMSFLLFMIGLNLLTFLFPFRGKENVLI